MSIPHNNQRPPHAGPLPPNNYGPPPVVRSNGPAPLSMEELCQPSIHVRGGPIASIPIQATDFGLRHHMIQQVQNTFQFHGLPGYDANRHIEFFLEVTQHTKQNGVFDDALRLSLFPYSLTHHATAWYDRLPRNSIHTFDDMMRKFLSKYFPPSTVTKLRNEITKLRQDPNESLVELEELLCRITPKECYELIENMTAHHNHWDTLATRDETSRKISSTTENLEAKSLGFEKSLGFGITSYPRGDVKAITTRSGIAYDGPTIPPTSSPLPKEVKHETEATKEKVKTTSSESIAHVQPLVVQVPIPEPDVAPKPNPKPSIPYPSRLNDRKLQEKDNNQMLKFLQFFQRLHFDLSFSDAILHIPKFASTFKSLLRNKEKLFELANTLLTGNSSAILLKKLPEKLRDPGRFLIPCDFQGLDSCMDLDNLGASINVTPLSVWKKLSLLVLTPTRMILELATRSFAYPTGIAEAVFVQKFTDEPALDYLPPPRDDDDDLFDLKSDNDEWKKLVYGDYYKDTDSEKDKNKDFKMKSLVVETYVVESNDLLPQLLDNDSTLPEESSEIATLSSSPFGNEDKVFNL
nr:reverse transcriptase domain-containing protein [Tanacetum cinerariifolium]